MDTCEVDGACSKTSTVVAPFRRGSDDLADHLALRGHRDKVCVWKRPSVRLGPRHLYARGVGTNPSLCLARDSAVFLRCSPDGRGDRAAATWSATTPRRHVSDIALPVGRGTTRPAHVAPAVSLSTLADQDDETFFASGRETFTGSLLSTNPQNMSAIPTSSPM